VHSHGHTTTTVSAPGGSVFLVGQPNVGKSALFNRLTRRYVAVSNYAGTTVEIARAAARFDPDRVVVDTPGVVTLPPHTDEERVTARVLLSEQVSAIVQVGDAKNMRRTLQFAVQLAEMGRPMVLALNMMDEARALGLEIDHAGLSRRLSVAVVPTVATMGEGVERLAQCLPSAEPPRLHVLYPEVVERAISDLRPDLPSCSVSPRALALAFVSDDDETEAWLAGVLDPSVLQGLRERRRRLAEGTAKPLAELVQRTRAEFVAGLMHAVRARQGERTRHRFPLGRVATHPVWGWPILALVLFGVYEFVGGFGAGTLVGLLEKELFGGYVNPWVTSLAQAWLPALVADFFVGEYGLWTMGMTYALALIFPIVTTFFLVFGALEDSGYFSRLVALSNRVFQALSLNGKAVLPMVLGLGCVTMATLTTRILETRRDRLIMTFLLALGIPCSAQLGVVMGMLSMLSFGATAIWTAVVLVMLGAVGWLAARIVPGEATPLLVELAPMRLPQLSNVLTKTLARLEWYLKEVVPLFLIGTTLMFVLHKVGVLPWLIETGKPLVTGWLGLPPEASAAFVMGFLRRDFGATGLFVMGAAGKLTALQAVVGMVAITLFIPCIASVLIVVREFGLKVAAIVVTVVFPIAFLVGGVLFRILRATGWGA
jgi:ferrous iron transport protein B